MPWRYRDLQRRLLQGLHGNMRLFDDYQRVPARDRKLLRRECSGVGVAPIRARIRQTDLLTPVVSDLRMLINCNSPTPTKVLLFSGLHSPHRTWAAEVFNQTPALPQDRELPPPSPRFTLNIVLNICASNPPCDWQMCELRGWSTSDYRARLRGARWTRASMLCKPHSTSVQTNSRACIEHCGA